MMETTRYVLRWYLSGPLYSTPVAHEKELEARNEVAARQEAAEFLSRPLVGDTKRTGVRIVKSTTRHEEQELSSATEYVEVQPFAAGRICDRLHTQDIGGEHTSGFCRACAHVFLVLNVLSERELIDLVVDRRILTPQTVGKDGEHLADPRVYVRPDPTRVVREWEDPDG